MVTCAECARLEIVNADLRAQAAEAERRASRSASALAELERAIRDHLAKTDDESLCPSPYRMLEDVVKDLDAARELSVAMAAKNAALQRKLFAAEARERAVVALLEAQQCECECDHHPDEHGHDCEICLGCRIGDALLGAASLGAVPDEEAR